MILLDSIQFGLTKTHFVTIYRTRENVDKWLPRTIEMYESGISMIGNQDGTVFYANLHRAANAYYKGVWDKNKQRQVWLPTLLLPFTLLALVVIKLIHSELHKER